MEWSEEKYDEFTKMMHEKHPKMFAYPYGGFCIGQGWWPIVQALCANIDHHIQWKRNMRAYDLRKIRAKKKGMEAVLKLICNGKEPRVWDEERAEEIMQNEIVPTPSVSHVVVHQIKEKFGGLRFYYEGGDERVHGMVSMAESWASRSCEDCGNVGKSRSGGWIKTLCDVHEAERKKKYEEYDA